MVSAGVFLATREFTVKKLTALTLTAPAMGFASVECACAEKAGRATTAVNQTATPSVACQIVLGMASLISTFNDVYVTNSGRDLTAPKKSATLTVALMEDAKEANASASTAGLEASAMTSFVTSGAWNTGSARTELVSAFKDGMVGTAHSRDAHVAAAAMGIALFRMETGSADATTAGMGLIAVFHWRRHVMIRLTMTMTDLLTVLIASAAPTKCAPTTRSVCPHLTLWTSCCESSRLQ